MQLLIQWYLGSFPGGGLGFAEIKNARSYTATPSYVYMEWSLINNRAKIILKITAFWNVAPCSLVGIYEFV
jgi:hypothetical protein